MLGKVFKAYDIRGTYPDPLDEKKAWQIGYGSARFLLAEAREAGETTPMMRHVVVGWDMRASSPSLRDALCEGIKDGGASVIDVGMVDTPLVYFAINHLDCAGGIQVTASHNPPQYNGFKVSRRKAKPVGEMNGLAEIRKLAATVDEKIRGSGEGHVEKRDLWDAYATHVRSFLGLGGKTLKIVVDASNGMAGTMVPKVFGRNGEAVEGLEIVEMYFDNSKGEFVHEPNPLVEANLADLKSRVVAEGADLGAVLAAINADATPDTRVHSALRMTAPPTEANGCLTSQGKPVRKAILDAHSDLIEAAYSKENDHARA
jgi:phosphomannomutase